MRYSGRGGELSGGWAWTEMRRSASGSPLGFGGLQLWMGGQGNPLPYWIDTLSAFVPSALPGYLERR